MTRTSTIDPCHCHVVRNASRYVTGFYDEALAPSGLRLTQFSMLFHLSRNAGAALGELADQLGLERTTATRNLKLLEREGYVTMAAAADDGRRKAIRLTDAGAAAVARAIPYWQAAQAAFEAKHSGTLVQRLHAILGELDADR